MGSAAVVVPVKSFTEAKVRLAGALDADQRAALAREMASVVLAAAAPLPAIVVCDEDAVRDWAERAGARVVWCPGRGLNGAVADGVEALGADGVEVAVVAHADLPLAIRLDWVGDFRGVTVVPDRRLDGSNALAIGAHPDDVEFGCGATLAKWAAAGCVVHHLVCTDGSKGTWNPDQDLTELVAQRHDEQRAAAKALGATGEVVFLDWPDGELQSGLRQRWQVAYWIRRLRPEVVLGHDPWKRYRLHPDHRHAGFLAVDGVVAARDPHFFPEQDIAHHRPAALLLFEADEADHVELADDEAAARKLAALEAHRSQLLSTMDVDLDSDEGEAQLSDFRSRVRQRLVAHGQIGGGGLREAVQELPPPLRPPARRRPAAGPP